MKLYQLYIKLDGVWTWVCKVEAESHDEGFRQALGALSPDDENQPIRLEPDDSPSNKTS